MLGINGVIGKIEAKADWVAYILEAYEAIPTYHGGLYGEYKGIGGMIKWFLETDPLKGGALNEIRETLGAGTTTGLLEEKLRSNHIYAAGLKYGAFAWVLQELGFFTKYRDTTEKVIKASALALLTLPGSGPYPSNGSASKGAQGRIQGY